MTPDLIAAWGAFAVAIIGAIGAIAYKAANKDAAGAPSPTSYLVLDANAVRALKEAMDLLTAALTRTARTLDAVAEGQERTQRALSTNSEAADKVEGAATELRIAVAALTHTMQSTALPRGR